MKNIKTKNIVKKALFFSLLLIATLAMSIPVLAACNGEPERYRMAIRTYYEQEEYFDPIGNDTRCTRTDSTCRIRLRGTLYYPLAAAYETPPHSEPAQFPAIILNHGSTEVFEANKELCEIANYFVPKGYIVFLPFRRGHGDDDGPQDKSTGQYIEDTLNDFVFFPENPFFDTDCLTRSCYKAELLREQADEDVAAAIEYLKTRPDVKSDGGRLLPYRIGILGNSYGGAVTIFANRQSLGQRAAVAFSPGAQQWAVADCPPNDQTCGSEFQRMLISAAGNADRPAFYLQAKWDYDTRATSDLAYAHAFGGSDHKHGQRYMSSIFPYPNPCPDRPCTNADYQSVHTGFIRDPDRWGPSVLDFFKQYGVE